MNKKDFFAKDTILDIKRIFRYSKWLRLFGDYVHNTNFSFINNKERLTRL